MPDAPANAEPLIPRRFACATADLAVYLLRAGSDNQARCLVVFDGRLDDARMRRAVRLSMDAEPILGCRLVERWWRPYWERLTDLDSRPICPLVLTDRPREEADRFLLDAIDPRVGPQVEVRIFRGEFDVLALRMNHEVVDGGAIKEYLNSLVALYRRLGEDPAYRPLPNVAGSRSMRQVARRLSFRDKLRVIRRAFRDARERRRGRGTFAFPMRPAQPEGKRLAVRLVAPDRTAAARALARRCGVSMNDLLVAASLRAMAAFIHPAPGVPVRLRATADQRRHLPEGRAEALCNLSGGYVLTLAEGLGDPLSETARRVNTRLTSLKNDFIGLGPWVFLPLLKWIPFRWLQRAVERAVLRARATPLPPQISNAGLFRFDFLRLGDVRATDFLLAGPLIDPPNFQLNFITVEETLLCNVSFYESGIEPARIEELFDRIEKELAEGT